MSHGSSAARASVTRSAQPMPVPDHLADRPVRHDPRISLAASRKRQRSREEKVERDNSETLPPSRAKAQVMCELVRVAVDSTADLKPLELAGAIEITPRGLQHRRQLAMYLSHVAFGVRTQDVARSFGRDTTTVYYAYRQVEDMRDHAGIDAFLDAIEQMVRTLFELALNGLPDTVGQDGGVAAGAGS